MQTTYATHLPIPVAAGESSLDTAVGAVAKWAQKRFGVTIQPLAGGRAVGRNASVEWSTLIGEDAGLFGLWVDHPDRGDRKWRWRTYVDVGAEAGSAWVRIRVHLYSIQEGYVTLPTVDAGRPGIVRSLVDDLGLYADGFQMGKPLMITVETLPILQRLLLMPGRQLPVVALSQDQARTTFIDAEHLADRLLGLAHVAEMEPDAASAFEEKLGHPLAVYGGAVRLFWPGLRTSDAPQRHRLFGPGALAFLGTEGLEAEIFGIIGRLAGLSLDEPKLRRKLRSEKQQRDISASIQERAEVVARLNLDSAAGTVTATEYSDLFTEYERLDGELTQLQEEALARNDEIEILEFERDDAREQLDGVLEEWRLSQGAATDDAEVDAADDSPVRSVIEAVRRASSETQACVFLDEAFSSAESSQYPHPVRVLEDLRLIEEIASQWKAGTLPNGPHAAFKERAPMYREGIGQTAETRYRSDYERIDDHGRPIMLAPHIRRGVGSVASILRIYMHFDTTAQRIVIGHVGRKLRDTTNRN